MNTRSKWAFAKLFAALTLTLVLLPGCEPAEPKVHILQAQRQDPRDLWIQSDGSKTIKFIYLDKKGALSDKNLEADHEALLTWCTWTGIVFYIARDGYLYYLDPKRKPDRKVAVVTQTNIREMDDIISIHDQSKNRFYVLAKGGIVYRITGSEVGAFPNKADLKAKELTKENTRVSWGYGGEGEEILLIVDHKGQRKGYRLSDDDFTVMLPERLKKLPPTKAP